MDLKKVKYEFEELVYRPLYMSTDSNDRNGRNVWRILASRPDLQDQLFDGNDLSNVVSWGLDEEKNTPEVRISLMEGLIRQTNERGMIHSQLEGILSSKEDMDTQVRKAVVKYIDAIIKCLTKNRQIAIDMDNN